jgi:hypothetical protein
MFAVWFVARDDTETVSFGLCSAFVGETSTVERSPLKTESQWFLALVILAFQTLQPSTLARRRFAYFNCNLFVATTYNEGMTKSRTHFSRVPL